MKRILTIIATLAAALTIAQGQTKDADGHVLVKLWKEYDKAKADDKPRTQSDILQKIKEQAKAQSLAWDFWDAASLYAEVNSDINWKLSDSLETALLRESEEFPDPIVGFAAKRWKVSEEELEKWVEDHKDGLLQGCNPMFYKKDTRISRQLSGALAGLIESDYEYTLWTRAIGPYSGNRDTCTKRLTELLGESYPKAPYLAYKAADREYSSKIKTEKLKAIVEKWSGKAVTLFPEASLLLEEFSLMQLDEDATQEDFKALRKKAVDLESRRLSYKGKEAEIVADLSEFKSTINTLDSKQIALHIELPKAYIMLRNLPSAWISVGKADSDEAPFFKQEVTNTANHYFIVDTLAVTLPDNGDGEFIVKVGSKLLLDKEESLTFSRYSYAISVNKSNDSFGLFATNASTGLPLNNVELVVLDDDDKGSQAYSIKLGNGYTPVPYLKNMTEDYHWARVFVKGKDSSGLPRRSPDNSISTWFDNSTSARLRGSLYKNTGAIHPGDTIRLKALVYKILPDGTYAPADNGSKFKLEIENPKGEEVFSEEVEVKGLGSIAINYAPENEAKSGVYRVRLYDGYYTLASDSFYYGEFVTPNFECTFDKQEKASFPGDTIHVSGLLQSFSGHKLSAAQVDYKVLRYGSQIAGGKAVPDASGHFDFAYIAPKKYSSSDYCAIVTVRDATGEVQEFSCWQNVSSYITLDADLVNKADGYELDHGMNLIEGAKALLLVKLNSAGLEVKECGFSYKIENLDGLVVKEGTGVSGETLKIDLSAHADGVYTIKVKSALGRTGISEKEDSLSFVKYTPGGTIPKGVRYLFRPGTTEVAPGGNICFTLGSGEHPVWAAMALYGASSKLLRTETIFIPKGSAKVTKVRYDKSYDDDVTLTLLYFNDYHCEQFSQTYFRKLPEPVLTLSATALADEASPGQEITVEIDCEPGAEAVASIWDKATDAIWKNRWNRLDLSRQISSAGHEYISIERPAPQYWYRAYGLVEEAPAAYSAADKRAELMLSDDVSNEVMDSSDDSTEGLNVRENFAAALFFDPFLKADVGGKLRFTFRASDKLSTYKVAVFAHDKSLRNNLIEKELIVTIPVKVDVLKPEYLVEGDQYRLAATVASATDEDVSGTLTLYRYDTADYRTAKPVSKTSVPLTVKAGETISHSFEISPLATLGRNDSELALGRNDNPSVTSSEAERSLSLLLSFKTQEGKGDAMFFTIPVLERAQTLTEAHSAVLRPDADKETLIADLRSRFTGTTADSACLKEVTIKDMVMETINGKLKEPGNDLLSVLEWVYLTEISPLATLGRNDSEAERSPFEKLFEYQNEDGGFAWFKGFRSSPILTAVVLERLAITSSDNSIVTSSEAERSHLANAVKYLDKAQFSEERALWYGGLSDAQYMYIRAQYADVQFTAPAKADKKAFTRFQTFKKEAKSYLVPSKARGLEGMILAKARRLATLRLLLASEDGKALSKAWGVKTSSKMEKSLKADVISLLEYAVEHKDGGWYYPNAVMPWRGLLESEAYAHALLANLLTDYNADIADGIRLWLMLQKETQHWDLNAHYADVVSCILSASEKTLNTKVISLTKTYRKPLEEIKAAGNGFSIERSLSREGEKLIATYKIYNAENRSFVRLRVPREAALRPVKQLSGMYGWNGYREVHSSYTDYFFESLAEETTVIREEFFVTQSGTFACGVPEIESLYAPHYRANGAFLEPLVN